MKINKQKVLLYSSEEGNKVIWKTLELEEKYDLVHVSLLEKDKNDPQKDLLLLVLKIVHQDKHVYISAGSYHRYSFDKISPFVLTAKAYISDIQKRVQAENNITNMDIRVYQELGIDTTPLLKVFNKRHQSKK